MTQKAIEKIRQNRPLQISDIEIFFTHQATDEDRCELLEALNTRGVTPQDIAEFVKYLLPRAFPEIKEAIDICGTGGSGLPKINTSTTASFILAACGVKIAKHGNRASGGRFGSFDLLESFGIKINLNPEDLEKMYEQENLTFIFAQKFYPVMRHFADVRRNMNVPTIFNLLGPLLNPSLVARQVIGTNNKKNALLIAEAAKTLGKRHVIVVTGEDGLDEVTLTGKTYCFQMKEGEISEFEVMPQDFGLEPVPFYQIAGSNPEHNIQMAFDILKGTCKTSHSDLVLMNVAFVLVFVGMAKDYKHGMELARNAVENGSAIDKFRKIKELSNTF